MPKKNAFRVSICLDESDRHIIEAAVANGLSPTAFFRSAWNRKFGERFGNLRVPDSTKFTSTNNPRRKAEVIPNDDMPLSRLNDHRLKFPR